MRIINSREIETLVVKLVFPVLFIFGYPIMSWLLGVEIPDWVIVFLVVAYIIMVHRFHNWFLKEYSERTFGNLVQNQSDIFNQSTNIIKMSFLEKYLTELSEKKEFIEKFYKKHKEGQKFKDCFELFEYRKKRAFDDSYIRRLSKVHNISSFYFATSIFRFVTQSYDYFADTISPQSRREELKSFDFFTAVTLLNVTFILGKNTLPVALAMFSHDVIKFFIMLVLEDYGYIKVYLNIYDKMISDYEYKKQLDFIDKRAYYQLDLDDVLQKKFL